MKKWICLSVLLFMVSCENERQVKPNFRPVKYESVKNLDKGIERTFAGTAQAQIETKLSFKVPGTIVKLPIRVGDLLKKGALIAQLDDLDYQLQMQEADASVLDSQAKMRNTAADYARIRELYETRSVSRQELDAALASYESGKANVKASKKKLELAEAQLKYTTLLAPLDGAISSIPTELGENVTIGETIAILQSGETIEVLVSIPEQFIWYVSKGDIVKVLFDSKPGRVFLGKVIKVGIATDVTTTYPVTAKLDEPAFGIRPGMSAEVNFVFLTSDEIYGVIVPSSAIFGEGEKRFVFILEPTENNLGIVKKREVKIGSISNQGIQVLGGLTDKDLIVTAGIPFLRDGETVRITQ